MTQSKSPSLRLTTFILILSLFTQFAAAQAPRQYNTTDIIQRLEKLNVLGTVLYVAAHPDDENTNVISYFANGRLTRTAYLSATRGDGGQNLIGPEIRESLGIIRTQELLAARRVDHGDQFFSRAVDFGYSKHPDETFDKWDREKVLSDFVRVYRKFRPDVIITRFSKQPGITHGHHTASAILAEEAFKISGNPDAFPDQLKELNPWQPSRIAWNTSWWFYSRTGQKFDTTGLYSVNVGAYSPILGSSFTEISAKSRSMHKSQGFGVSASRGDEYEYFVNLVNQKEGNDIFDGIDISWGRVEGGEKVKYFIDEAQAIFDPANPHHIIEDLLSARRELLALNDQHWKQIKLQEIDELIIAITGTYIKLTTRQESFALGDSITIMGEVINRSPVNINLASADINITDETMLFNLDLAQNKASQMTFQMVIPEDFDISQPYWLIEEGTEGMFRVDDPFKIGKPENDPAIFGRVTLRIDDQFIDYQVPVVYNYTDPVDGEVYKPIHITPPVMVSTLQDVVIFGNNDPKEIAVEVIAGRNDIAGEVKLDLPLGWKSIPEIHPFSLATKGQQKQYSFMVTPVQKQGQYKIGVSASYGGKNYQRDQKTIEYDHIPTQALFPKTEISASKIELEIDNKKIGYIMGAGDLVPQALEQIGYQVSILSEDEVSREHLNQYDAIILGVRAFNTLDWLAIKNQTLFEYVRKGGNLIVQYNTTSRLITEAVSPFTIGISRNRVAVEDAEVRILDPKDPVLNYPNKITTTDFEGWVQERGLYFPDSWSQELRPVFSMNDPGEEPLDGSLLIGKYGNGNYAYTSLSFFRELPAGVPGAYRLLVNLISMGNKKEQ